MTDADFDLITKWQTTPEGTAFTRICTLGGVIADLRDFMLHREGAKELRQRTNINALIEHRHELDALIEDAVNQYRLANGIDEGERNPTRTPTIILSAELGP
jgi:hypothetical protein